MPTYDRPIEIYKKQRRVFDAFPGTARQAWRQIPEGGFRDLKEFTSGSISSNELARRGHPYARGGKGTRRGTSKAYVRRNGKGEAPLLPINRQSARLNRSITLYRRSSAYSLEESVGFDKSKAGNSIFAVLPLGTRYVVPRGIWVAVKSRGRARGKAFNDRYFQDQLANWAKP